MERGLKYEGVRGVAGPVRDYSGEVVAAVTITVPTSRITKSKLPELAEHVIKAADNISSRLVYRPKVKATPVEHTAPMRFVAYSAREPVG